MKISYIELTLLEKFYLLNRLREYGFFPTIENLHITKLLVGDSQDPYFPRRG